MGGSISDYLLPVGIGASLFAPMLFPAAAAAGAAGAGMAGTGLAAGAAAPMMGIGPGGLGAASIGGALPAMGIGAGSVMPAVPGGLGLFGGLNGMMNNPLFKMGSQMLMNQGQDEQQPPMMMPPAMPPGGGGGMPPGGGGSLADAAAAIPTPYQPGMTMGPSPASPGIPYYDYFAQQGGPMGMPPLLGMRSTSGY